MYFSGQGKVYVAQQDVTGNPGVFRYIGNVSALTVGVATDLLEHKESTSGQRLTDLRLQRGKSSTMSCTMQDFDKKNIALAFQGTDSAGTGASVTGEAFPTLVAVGDIIRLAHTKISALVIKDSTPVTPLNATTPVNYTFDPDFGTVTIAALTPPTLVQPLKADYTYAASPQVNFLTGSNPDRWFRFEGLNTANNNAKTLVEFYRCSLTPAKELALISDDVMSLAMDGSVLYDANKVADAVLGQFGRIVYIP
jgi:hypothetical protein